VEGADHNANGQHSNEELYLAAPEKEVRRHKDLTCCLNRLRAGALGARQQR
jgi:hypothetical protein